MTFELYQQKSELESKINHQLHSLIASETRKEDTIVALQDKLDREDQFLKNETKKLQSLMQEKDSKDKVLAKLNSEEKDLQNSLNTTKSSLTQALSKAQAEASEIMKLKSEVSKLQKTRDDLNNEVK